MRIIRVFPHKSDWIPSDDLCFVGDPPLWRPPAECIDEVHVSIAFTWDITEGERLRDAWAQYYPTVKVGGPAFGTRAQEHFTPGRYIKRGVTFTSMGCDNFCDHCLVWRVEGPLVPFKRFCAGYIIQDNNLLQTPASHRRRVFKMLSKQRKAAEFKGGLEADLITDEIADEMRGLRIAEVWLACDARESIEPLRLAAQKLSFLGLRSNKMRCYVLIGKDDATPQDAEARLEQVWDAGCMPFAQLYQPPERERVVYPKEWRDLQRKWSRPAAIRSSHKDGRGDARD